MPKRMKREETGCRSKRLAKSSSLVAFLPSGLYDGHDGGQLSVYSREEMLDAGDNAAQVTLTTRTIIMRGRCDRHGGEEHTGDKEGRKGAGWLAAGAGKYRKAKQSKAKQRSVRVRASQGESFLSGSPKVTPPLAKTALSPYIHT